MQTIGLILKLNLLGMISRRVLRSTTYLTADISRGIAEGYQYDIPWGAILTAQVLESKSTDFAEERTTMSRKGSL
jgi:hypothetical protein